MPYRAILFDLDGTLLDTLADIANATNAALRAMGFPEHPTDAYRIFVGDGVENLVRRVIPAERHDPAVLHELAQRMRGEYGQHWADHTRPYPGVAELLDGLTQRGIPMTIVSNKPHAFTLLCVERFLSQWTFAAVQGEQPPVPKKPNPAMPLQIARSLNLAPADFIYLGDTNTDMQTAVDAGMFPVGALWGFRDAQELVLNGARVLIANPVDLLRIVDE